MDLAAWLERCPIVAILRGITRVEVQPVFSALEAAGISIAEIPLNSPDPIASIAEAVNHFGGRLLVGAGTVTDPKQVKQIASAGGHLIVTPHADPAIVRAAKDLDLIAIPGIGTATEAFAMLQAGADALKLFPADVGGVALLKGLRAVLPLGTKLIPVGGVDLNSMPTWKKAGVSGYGIGSALYKPGDSAQQVRERAAAFVSLSHGRQ